MDAAVSAQLVALNRSFYDDFGRAFSATRGRIQPGMRRILSELAGDECILDLGCGNGQLARTLAERGHRGAYLGLDFSLPLLQEAERQPEGFHVHFHLADITTPNWLPPNLSNFQLSTFQPPTFNLIFAFAVLHHIPGQEMRQRILQKARGLLASGGRFVHSEWQFLESEKLKARIQPWERIGLSAADVDPGDALLDWRSGGNGLRYAHHFSAQELTDLATAARFRVVESFSSDGAGGRLGLYQTWEAV